MILPYKGRIRLKSYGERKRIKVGCIDIYICMKSVIVVGYAFIFNPLTIVILDLLYLPTISNSLRLATPYDKQLPTISNSLRLAIRLATPYD